jgi:hypothetical protein
MCIAQPFFVKINTKLVPWIKVAQKLRSSVIFKAIPKVNNRQEAKIRPIWSPGLETNDLLPFLRKGLKKMSNYFVR